MPRSSSTPVEPVTLAFPHSRSRHSLLDCFAPPHGAHPAGVPAGRLARSARFSITLLDLLPLVAFTGLYQPSGGCEPPCGLCNFVPCGDLRFRFAFKRRTAPGSLCTLQSCCFPTRGPRPLGMMFGDAVSSAILMGWPIQLQHSVVSTCQVLKHQGFHLTRSALLGSAHNDEA